MAGTATICALIAGTGIAYASWNASSQNGTGGSVATTAYAATAAFDSATPAAAYSQQLYPGVSNGDLMVKVTAPSQYGVTITGFSQSGAATGCTTTGVTVNTEHSSSSSLSGVTIAAGASVWFKLTGALRMDNTSSSDCAGATISVPLTANATSLPNATTSPSGTSASSPSSIVW